MNRIFTLSFLWIFFTGLLFSVAAKAQSLHLFHRTVTLQADEQELKTGRQAGQLYVHCSKSPGKSALQTAGILLQGTVQPNVYYAVIPSGISAQQLLSLGIDSWSTVLPTDKINPLLDYKNKGTTEQVLLLSVTKNMPVTDLQQQLTGYGGRLSAEQSWKKQDLWQIHLPSDKVEALAATAFVRSLTPKFEPKPFLQQAMGFTNSQTAHQPVSVGGHDLNAAGVTIGVGDNSDPEHIDFIDRIRSFNPVWGNDHGFHTTGTVGGNGIRDERYKGFANKCNLISDFFSQVIANGATYLQDFNMVISNNSYGNVVGNCGYAGTYDSYSEFVDEQMRDNPTLLHVFASANDGLMTCSPYPLGYATVTAAFASSKNVLTVGALGKKEEWAAGSQYSSQGPAKDGRLKPEITAVGTMLYSTIENNNYAWNSGTSMACPNVAGASGLLYQRYRQLFAGQDPKAALVKTLLMNGAGDLGTAGPDYRYGFGLMNIGHSLTMLDSARYFTNTINTNQEQTFTFNIPANTAQAKVLLYWSDAPAAALSTNTLINDLDLTVVSPSSAINLPLILNPAPAQVTAAAVPGADHTNNVEQVTLNNPAAGTYTIKVKGFNVPEINQDYFVAYDFTPDGIAMHYPFGGEALIAGDSMIIYWEASAGANTFSIAYSTDNGANWNTIDNNVAASLRSYTWMVPASIASDQCLVKVNRNSSAQQAQSKAFSIMGRPLISLSPVAEQCPGSVKITWNAIAGAGSYRIFKKTGDDMAVVATVSGTSYTFTGLRPDSTYWVTAAPVINGHTGMRGVAVSRQPSDGSCTGITAHGDLSVTRIVAPGSGRQFTSSALSNAQPLTVLISNLDDQAAANYKIAYKVNNNPWSSNNYTDIVTPAGNRQIILGNLNLSAAGSYTITVAIANQATADPVTANDTMEITVRQLDNPVMNLSAEYTEDFEATGNLDATGYSIMGISGAGKWDFTQSQPRGRIRSFVNSDITIGGSKSASMDNARNQRYDIPGSSYNTLTGTFNLSTYNTVNWEVRCEFDYIMHGVPKFDTGNRVWVRGSDTDPWIPLLQYQIDTANLGVIYHSGTLSLTDILGAAGQTFSSSTQVRFTQYDTSRIAATYFGNGVTMDNFKLYTVTDDVQLLAMDSIYHYNCGLSAAVPLKIRVRNGVNNTVYNIAVSYQLDNQAVVNGMIDSIPGKDTATYTFTQTMDLSANTSYSLSSWIYVATDTYRLNDSIVNFNIKNQPVITLFPYLQDFEQNDGFYYAEGNNSSWAYGQPASPKINHAASGQKAWKTTLEGNYNNMEYSYLYSPCFDISLLTNPTLSFNLATDIEDPGSSIYDMAYVEYSHDGHNWQKLGRKDEGTNWYGDSTAQAWTKSGEDYWHVATIPLPKDGDIVSFRFVIRSDQGTSLEGVAIDDIHVYDLQQPIFDQEQFPSAISQNVGAGQTVTFVSGNDIGVALLNSTAALGNTAVQAYKHTQFINEDSTQYYLPKNFTIQPANTPGDSVTVRLYVPDEAMRTIREDATCYSCSKSREVQELGITKYDDPDKQLENNTLADNKNGIYSFIPKDKIRWVPYDVGYYAETKVRSFSEFWFNDGGPTKDQPVSAHLFSFSAAHYGARYALLNWTSYIDAQTLQYEIQRADGSMNFSTVATVNAVGTNGQSYSYIDTPVLSGPVTYYRIRYHMQDGGTYLSVIRSLDWGGTDGLLQVYPNPVRNGMLNIEWFKGNGDKLQWSMYNLMGQQVVNGFTESNTYNGRYSLDLSRMGLSAGVYVLRVVSGKDKWEFKIVYQ